MNGSVTGTHHQLVEHVGHEQRDCVYRMRSQLFYVVFGNGLLYYVYLFERKFDKLLFNMPSLKLALTSTECVLHPILGCRVMLDIRGPKRSSILHPIASMMPTF